MKLSKTITVQIKGGAAITLAVARGTRPPRSGPPRMGTCPPGRLRSSYLARTDLPQMRPEESGGLSGPGCDGRKRNLHLHGVRRRAWLAR